MIDACVKCGNLPKALEIFEGMVTSAVAASLAAVRTAYSRVVAIGRPQGPAGYLDRPV